MNQSVFQSGIFCLENTLLVVFKIYMVVTCNVVTHDRRTGPSCPQPPESVWGVIKTITVEPVILLYMGGIFLLWGSQIPTNVLILKICKYEMV
jgi:hypothetical protein